MAEKKIPVTFRVPEGLAKRFDDATQLFQGKKGACFAGAMIMFLESHPEQQGAFVKRAHALDVDADVESVLESLAAEQQRKIKEKKESAKAHPKSR